MTDEVFEREAYADDRAFYLQRTFRALLDAMARPGEVAEIGDRAQGDACDAEASGLTPSALMLADVLLDAATSAAVAGPDGESAALVLARRTHVAAAPAAEAAVAFVPASVRGEAAAAFVSELSAGTLADPHLGATCIVAADTVIGVDRDGLRTGALSGASEVGAWRLSGPGIRGTVDVELDRVDVMGARAARGDEFPLGIDLVFVDGAGHVLCLPRTTRAERIETACDRKEGAAWDM